MIRCKRSIEFIQRTLFYFQSVKTLQCRSLISFKLMSVFPFASTIAAFSDLVFLFFRFTKKKIKGAKLC